MLDAVLVPTVTSAAAVVVDQPRHVSATTVGVTAMVSVAPHGPIRAVTTARVLVPFAPESDSESATMLTISFRDRLALRDARRTTTPD